MLTEIHCPCGHRRECKPSKLKPKLRCRGCGKSLTFKSSRRDEARWLVVGGSDGQARLAVPIPQKTKLTVGSGLDCWLVLPAEDVAEAQVEIALKSDMRLSVRHLDGAGGTWINRASIVSGVAGEKDTIRVGPFRLYLRREGALPIPGKAGTVIVEEAEEEERQVVVEEEGDEEYEYDFTTGYEPRGRKLKAAIYLAILLAALGYLSKTYFFPDLSPDMPEDVEVRCPIDDTVFRVSWKNPLPLCPECGQLCLGAVKPRTSSAAQDATSRPARETRPRGNSNGGGEPQGRGEPK